MVVNFSACLFFLMFGFLFRQKKTIWWFVAVDVLISILLFCDAVYFRAFGSLPSVTALNQAGMLENFGTVTFSLLKSIDLIFFVDLPMLILLAFIADVPVRKTNKSFIVYLIVFVVVLGSYIAKDAVLDKKSIVGIDLKASTVVVKVLGVSGYHFLDLCSAVVGLDTKHEHISATAEAEVRKWLSWNYENLKPNNYQGIFAGKNLIVVQVESLERFQMYQMVEGQEVTPTLNRLAEEGIYFTNFHAQEGEGQTSDGEFMLNSGCYRLTKGTPCYEYPRNKYISLPKLFEEKGYRTYAAHPDDASTWNWFQVDTNMGYETCYSVKDFVYDEKIGYGIGDKPFLEQYFEKVKTFKQPFQALVLTLSLHADFDLPEDKLTLTVPAEIKNHYLGKYLRAARYTDEAIAELIASLDKIGLLDNTVLVFYGDHPSLHKFYQDDVNATVWQGDWWQQNYHRVPLIIYSKGMKPYSSDINGGQVDLLPTICYLFGIDASKYSQSAFGRNLMNTNRNYCLIPGGELFGSYSDRDKAMILKGSDYSELAIKGNMWGTVLEK
jgi:phosphoglycerol transferase MdoB-like AlkP superfamily enzyme